MSVVGVVRRGLLTLLALVGVGCALVVTASSTMAQASAAGMRGLVPAALVGLLEVVNVAGTWTWITDRRPNVRLEAAVGVAAASTVTAWCGAVTYGPLGLVAPAGLLAAVHLVSRMWAVDEAPSQVGTSSAGAKPEAVSLAPPTAEGPAAGVEAAITATEVASSGPMAASPVQVAADLAAEGDREPVRLDQQQTRRRPSVAATSTSAGRAAPTEDRAA